MSNNQSRHSEKSVSLISLGWALGLISGGAWIGLLLPDLDLLVFPILHHRSFLTHSILLPLLFKRWMPDGMFAGILYGVSIHLWADSLGTAKGFAQIYFPIEKTSFGQAGSVVWLLGNAILGFLIATRIYKRFPWIVIGIYFFIAIAYAVLNEGIGFLAYVLAVLGMVMTILYFKSGRFKKHRLDRPLSSFEEDSNETIT